MTGLLINTQNLKMPLSPKSYSLFVKVSRDTSFSGIKCVNELMFSGNAANTLNCKNFLISDSNCNVKNSSGSWSACRLFHANAATVPASSNGLEGRCFTMLNYGCFLLLSCLAAACPRRLRRAGGACFSTGCKAA